MPRFFRDVGMHVRTCICTNRWHLKKCVAKKFSELTKKKEVCLLSETVKECPCRKCEVLLDVTYIHNTTFPAIREYMLELFLAKWSDEPDFLAYWSKYQSWRLFSRCDCPPGFATTNNTIESINKYAHAFGCICTCACTDMCTCRVLKDFLGRLSYCFGIQLTRLKEACTHAMHGYACMCMRPNLHAHMHTHMQFVQNDSIFAARSAIPVEPKISQKQWVLGQARYAAGITACVKTVGSVTTIPSLATFKEHAGATPAETAKNMASEQKIWTEIIRRPKHTCTKVLLHDHACVHMNVHACTNTCAMTKVLAEKVSFDSLCLWSVSHNEVKDVPKNVLDNYPAGCAEKALVKSCSCPTYHHDVVCQHTLPISISMFG